MEKKIKQKLQWNLLIFLTGQCVAIVRRNLLMFANLLKFNGNKVTKYYINDYGNQINNFQSQFFTNREIKYNEKFVPEKDLYPGEYIIQIAKKIIDSRK